MRQMLFVGWGEGLALCELEATKKLQEGYRLQNFNLNLILTCNKYKQYWFLGLNAGSTRTG